ncbi:hypothetical protein NE237_008166 [Protea cynaroides]|uniref:Uncharacterized protein n=1 Tax=Protea cynaroides TaxID=273540 RepID=A0A9Q0KQJ1_9MAGN|nr:hypothetical protein NE237_008166 [Protea cynaroides]
MVRNTEEMSNITKILYRSREIKGKYEKAAFLPEKELKSFSLVSLVSICRYSFSILHFVCNISAGNDEAWKAASRPSSSGGCSGCISGTGVRVLCFLRSVLGEEGVSVRCNGALRSPVTATLLNFVRMFQKAHDENCKQAELERKKAQKEAEMEKAKGVNLTKKTAT